MDDLDVRKNLSEKLENFLDQACQAEVRDNNKKAERLFRLALYCEGKLKTGVNVKQYVEEAGPVYEETQLVTSTCNAG